MKKFFTTSFITLLLSLFAFTPELAAKKKSYPLPEAPSVIEIGYTIEMKVYESNSNYLEVLNEPGENEEMVLIINGDKISIKEKKPDRYKRFKETSQKVVKIHLYTTNPNKLKRLDIGGITKLEIVPVLSPNHPFRLNLSGTSEAKLDVNGKNVHYTVSGVSKLLSKVNASEFRLNLSGMAIASLTADAPESWLKQSGASNAVIRLHTDEVEVTLSGTSSLTLKGSSKWMQAKTSGTSNLNATEFPSATASVRASGVSKVAVNVSGKLTLNTSGISKVSNVN